MALYERLEDRTTQVYWRPWSASSINRRYQGLLELLQVGLRLARPPDPPPLRNNRPCNGRLEGSLKTAQRSGKAWHWYYRNPRCTL